MNTKHFTGQATAKLILIPKSSIRQLRQNKEHLATTERKKMNQNQRQRQQRQQ